MASAPASFSVTPEIVELADATARRRPPTRLAWSWAEGLLLYALLRLDAHLGRARYRAFAETYFAHHAARPTIIEWSDQCPPGLAALELYAATGRPEHLATAERVAQYLRAEPRTKDGGLNHFGVSRWARFYPQSMWVDSLMMYGVFAARFGRLMRDEEMTRFAVEQPPLFARVLRDPVTGLYRHAWWVEMKRAVPRTGYWLRGNGWVLASLVEVLDAVPDGLAGRAELATMLRQLATAVVGYQLPSGLFPTVLGRASPPETSGTALIAYALLAGVRAGHLPSSFDEPAARAYRSLLAQLERRPGGLSMIGISGPTMPYPSWGYALVPRVRDAAHGIAAMVLAGIAAGGRNF
jgi:unsaturated rhamnogalacturonyl hydrolase